MSSVPPKARREPSLQSLLAQAHRQAAGDLEQLLDSEGMPVENWRVLEVLADQNGRPMSALAESLQMKLPSLSKLLDRMVAAALVQRAPDPDDQRRVLVYISDLGLARVKGLRGPVRRQLSSIESVLGEHEGRELKRLLQAFIERRA